MKNYFSDKNGMSIPWIESPFFKYIIDNDRDQYTDEEYDLLWNFHEKGYVILDNVLTKKQCKWLIADIQELIDEENYTKQNPKYEYSDSPRIFEAWKTSANVLALCKNKKILDTLKLLYGRPPIPFQTINFKIGANQPLHSDAIHFHTIPHRWMVGTWTALEDMSSKNGTLTYVPGSHKWPMYEFPDLNLEVPKHGEQFEQYAEYENFLRQLVTVNEADSEILKCKAGSTIIWATNLLHGSIPIKNKKSTRWSQATHYYFEGCEHYYCPLFSNWHEGDWSEKDLTQKDILGHNI